MTDSERLIELILQGENEADKKGIANCQMYNLEKAKILAEHLISNGVIVPPCKVGDTVYMLGVFTGQIIETKVEGIHYNQSGIYLCFENFTTASIDQQLGKTVFLTKEEAEEKLKELGK